MGFVFVSLFLSVGRIFVRIDHWHRDKNQSNKKNRWLFYLFFLSLFQCNNVLFKQLHNVTHAHAHAHARTHALQQLADVIWAVAVRPPPLIYSFIPDSSSGVQPSLVPVSSHASSCHCAAELVGIVLFFFIYIYVAWGKLESSLDSDGVCMLRLRWFRV